jgi:hypothetical protein
MDFLYGKFHAMPRIVTAVELRMRVAAAAHQLPKEAWR